MAANLTDYLEAKIVDHFLRNVAYTPPATVYVGLLSSTATTTSLETGSATGELSGGSYARQTIAFAAASSPGGSTQNTADVNFTNLPAGDVTYSALFDAATAGNMLVWAPLLAAKTLNLGDSFQFPAGSWTFALA